MKGATTLSLTTFNIMTIRTVVKNDSIMTPEEELCYAQCCQNAGCQYAKCHYAECRGAKLEDMKTNKNMQAENI